jgi:hypothetical protein
MVTSTVSVARELVVAVVLATVAVLAEVAEAGSVEGAATGTMKDTHTY